MTHHPPAIWTFSNSVSSTRQNQLLSKFDRFESVVAELLLTASIIDAGWEPNAIGHRTIFRLSVPQSTYDQFFNSPFGYRAQYARSVTYGEAANRILIKHFLPCLRQASAGLAAPANLSVVASLRAAEAKIWILEDEVHEQLGDDEPEILFPRWVSAVTRGEADGAGIRAPVGTTLEIKGGWLDRLGSPVSNPLKQSRSQDLYDFGFS